MAGDKWSQMPLGKFVTLQRGHDLPDERRRKGSVPILGSFGITGWHDMAKAPGPGVTVGRSGASFGVVNYSPVDYWPLNTALYVIDFHGNDERFAYYLLKCFDFQGYNSGSAQPSLNRNFIHPVPIDVPPLSEQKAIAHILGTLDDKIELNRRMNETLEAMARALFQSWFIDFDPVRRNAVRAQNQPSPQPSPMGRGGLPGGSIPGGGIPGGSISREGAGMGNAERGKGNYRGGFDFSGLLETARALRRKQTPAEAVFWALVRDRQLMGLKFRRQHQLGDYVADFYCHERRLVVELDGGVHASKQKKDHKRDAWMVAQGFNVLRFPNEQVLEDPMSVLAQCAEAGGGVLGSSPLGRGGSEGLGSSPLGPGGSEGLGSSPLGPGGSEGLGSSPLGRGGGEGSVEDLDRLFPDSFEESELGEIPKGWLVETIKHCCVQIQNGGTPRRNEPRFWDGGTVPWLTSGEVRQSIIASVENRITDAGLAESSAKWVSPLSTVVALYGATAGQVALITSQLTTNQAVCALMPRKNYEFFNYLWMRNATADLENKAVGSAQQNISKGIVEETLTIMPTELVLERFARSVCPFFERWICNLHESNTLAALRDALLPKLLSGEIRVDTKGAGGI